MSVLQSTLMPEAAVAPVRSVAAVVYPNEVYPNAVFQHLVARCRARGVSLAGVLQHPACDDPGRHCDVILEDLTSGHRTVLYEERGALARGCRLDQSALAEATARVEGNLETAPDLLVLNKFGKVECEGGGLRDLIASAMDRDMAVIIGVPARNLEAWRAFTGEFAVELPPDAAQIERWLDAVAVSNESAMAPS
jgi:nucleoside-triphosphatase THEP1